MSDTKFEFDKAVSDRIRAEAMLAAFKVLAAHGPTPSIAAIDGAFEAATGVYRDDESGKDIFIEDEEAVAAAFCAYYLFEEPVEDVTGVLAREPQAYGGAGQKLLLFAMAFKSKESQDRAEMDREDAEQLSNILARADEIDAGQDGSE